MRRCRSAPRWDRSRSPTRSCTLRIPSSRSSSSSRLYRSQRTTVKFLATSGGRVWCRGWESNPHGPHGPRDFKSRVSTSSTTSASTAPRATDCSGMVPLRAGARHRSARLVLPGGPGSMVRRRPRSRRYRRATRVARGRTRSVRAGSRVSRAAPAPGRPPARAASGRPDSWSTARPRT